MKTLSQVLALVFLLSCGPPPEMYTKVSCEMPDRTIQYVIHESGLVEDSFDIWAYDLTNDTQLIVDTVGTVGGCQSLIDDALSLNCRALGGRIIRDEERTKVE